MWTNDAGYLTSHDGNNYTSGISFSGTTTKTLYLSRAGLDQLTATFTDNDSWPGFGTTGSTACVGNDSRLSDSRPASDVYSWAKASSKPSYTYSEIGAAASDHGHSGVYEPVISTLTTSKGGTNNGTYTHGQFLMFQSSNSAIVSSGYSASSFATLSSPAFTGTPTAPTASTSDNSTQIATTAFVKNQGYVTSGVSGSGSSGYLAVWNGSSSLTYNSTWSATTSGTIEAGTLRSTGDVIAYYSSSDKRLKAKDCVYVGVPETN